MLAILRPGKEVDLRRGENFGLRLTTARMQCLRLSERFLDYISCDITLSFLIYSAGCYLFCEHCQPWHFVHHLLPPVRNCSNVTDLYELSDFWLPNSSDRNIFHYKIWGSESTRKSIGCERFEAASDWCMSSSGTECYWWWHWSVA